MFRLRGMKGAKISVVLTAFLMFSGCTLGGAVAGGYAGNKLTHGSAVGTVGGAVAGGIVGHELGK